MLCALAGVLLFAGVSAKAAVTHAYLPEVSRAITEGVPASSGAPLPGPVAGTGSMAVDSGHLWVAESIPGEGVKGTRIDEFDAGTGAFVSQLPQVPSLTFLFQGVAVAHGTGDVYVAGDVAGTKEGRVAVFSGAGVLLGVWSGADTPGEAKAFGCFECDGPGGVAVDNSVSGPAAGDVYVSSPLLRVVDVFKKPAVDGKEPLEANVGQLTGTCPVEGTTCEPAEVIPFNGPTHVAVDEATGDLLVLDAGVVDLFEPEVLGGYVFLRQVRPPEGDSPNNLAVDGVSGEIYVAGQADQEHGGLGFVAQFSGTGVFLGRITGENTPAGDLRSPASLAVDPESHRVYLGDYRGGGNPVQTSVVDVFGPDLIIPDVTTGPATGMTPYSATLTGTVGLDKAGEASCRFLWGTTKEFQQPPAPCSGPATEEESSVQATLSQATGNKLEPDTTYFYRLQATNKNGLNPGDPSQDQEFLTSGPGIHEEAVSNVAATSVTFDAKVDPNHSPATSYFQYGTSNAYGTNVPAVPGESLGAGKGDVEVTSQHVQGLSVGTVYHYRVVVLSELSPGHVEEFDGTDQTFTTQQSGGALELPDGRSWEMVTPPEKKGALFRHIEAALIQASSNGDAMANIASQPTEAEPQGYSPFVVSVLSTRGGADWASQAIAPPNEEGTGAGVGESSEYKFFSDDLSLGLVQPIGNFTPLSPAASEPTAYLRTDYSNGDVSAHCQSSCYTPLVTSANTPSGTVFGGLSNGVCLKIICGPRFAGATPDMSHVILYTEDEEAQLTSIPTTGTGLYEWSAGLLRLVNVLPETEGGKASHGGQFGGPAQLNARHAISDDGSRVVWTGQGADKRVHLYLRDMARGETVRLDLPQGGSVTGSHEPVFMDASSDDSRIYFLDQERLTGESSAGGEDLYEYDLNAPLGSRLTDLTVDTHAIETNSSGVLGISEDGSYVYFRAAGVLAPGAVHGECQSDSPCENLYVRHDGVTKWIAAQSREDVPAATSSLDGLAVRVSPNGRWMAFGSDRNLTGYDAHDAVSGRPDQEVYLYDAVSRRLVCASCNPSGARPVGFDNAQASATLVDAVSADKSWVASNVPPWTKFNAGSARYQSRYLSDSGRLFFNSNDALVSQDVNGTEDVYEYEPVGVPAGSVYECTTGSVRFSGRLGGCVGLISSGASSEESGFLDASATGGDVFFLTASKLSSMDFDTALDVYDAHECRSEAPCFAISPVAPPACSTGDSCKASPSPQPSVFGSPSSATFSGAGNVTPLAPSSAVKSKSLTRAQKLVRALRACGRKHAHSRRRVCERRASKRYGASQSRKAGNTTKKSGR